MTQYPSDKIRSVALVGHGGCGKTTIAETFAVLTGQTKTVGKAGHESSLMDFEVEEHKRGGTVKASFLTCEYDGYRVHVVDTPGDGNFLHEARVALNAVDAAVIVVSAVDGVEVSTEKMAAAAAGAGRPCAVFINKMDREYADHKQAISDVKALLGLTPVVLQLPIGSESDFVGVVDLLNMTAHRYDDGKDVEIPVPEGLEGDIAVAREAMMEAVAEVDDELIERYLEEGELSEEELRRGLNQGITKGALVPVLLGSAETNIALDKILWLARALPSALDRGQWPGHAPGDADSVVAREPDAEAPFSALCVKTYIDPFAGQISVFRCVSGTANGASHPKNTRADDGERFGSIFFLQGKNRLPADEVRPGDVFGVAKLKHTQTGDTVCDPKHPVVLPFLGAPPPMLSFTVKPRSRKDVDKLKSALSRLLLEDVGLQQSYDDVTKELILAAMGQVHVSMSVDKMSRKYGVQVDLGTPAIPYRETIQGRADVRYRHRKQTGGAGQFGEVAIRVFASDRGEGFQFVNRIVGGVIPGSLIPSVEKGVRDQLNRGVLCGFPVVDVTVELYDGKYHPVDSKDIAFQIAGRHAVKKGVVEARPVLLEPINEIDIVVPELMVGDVMGDMNSRRGRISSMEARGRNSVVKALVPLAEILNYAPELRAMTGGKGSFTMHFARYEPVPSHMQDKLVRDLNRLSEDEG
jgi:elongation factor G